MKYKLQLWDEGELRDAPIEEWVIGLDRTADFNVKDFTDQQWLLAAIQRKCAEEDVREAERAYERSQGDAWDGGFADNH